MNESKGRRDGRGVTWTALVLRCHGFPLTFKPGGTINVKTQGRFSKRREKSVIFFFSFLVP